MNSSPVLITWIAVNNDPYELDLKTDRPHQVNGERVAGPTLTLLFDPESSYAGRISEVVLLHRSPEGGETRREKQAVDNLRTTLQERRIQVHLERWDGDDPTDHRAIFAFLRDKLPKLRRRFVDQELVLHISPGTPSMQTVWVLMAETGYIDPPFTVVKSYRRAERRGRRAVVSVELGIATYFKAYKASRPRGVVAEDQVVLLDPRRFQGAGMQRIFAEARRFAPLKVPVLLRGERGTGKTTLASWIRSNSPFKRDEQDARWPSVACGQYSPETMRAELFGYKKGSFTGAMTDRPGLLAAAHRDTLFLDEVGDISRDLQRLLIRAIEEKRYLALGDDTPRESDFRLITATNIDDHALRERLDPDFLDRIGLLTLTLPPLRDVPEELPWLWEAVYREATRRAGVAPKRVILDRAGHAKVVESLSRHPLPGNLRDLFRVTYRILAALLDADEPLSPTNAVGYGLECLDDNASAPPLSASHAIAAAFVHGTSIGDVIENFGALNTSEILGDLKRFIATELRRIGAQRDARAEDLCDVSARSLRDWAKPSPVRKNSSS